VKVFDGHNDALLRIYLDRTPAAFEAFLNGGSNAHIDLPKAKAGGLAGGLFAIFPPSPMNGDMFDRMSADGYSLPLPEALAHPEGADATIAMASILFRLEAASKGGLTVCRTVAEIQAAMARGSFAAVLHIEGAEAIDPELRMLDVLFAAGLRSVGMVWSRPNHFAEGVPMRFPSSPDTGAGLYEPGRRLVKRCNELGILLDLSHLNEKGFWEVAELSDAPLVATHSNVHRICTVSRNLTDAQLDAIARSRGVVGLNFATAFLREDGRMDADTPLETMRRHLDALLERLGEDGVALGSDFDGATIPNEIGTAEGLPKLIDHLAAAGYGETLLEKIAFRNWLSVLTRTWKA
jgi:membrane dipeptidase